MPKLQKYRPKSTDANLVYRSATVVKGMSCDDETRSIPIVLASETPVQMFDRDRGEIVDEVILMAGVDVPRQVPLLDSHDRSSVRNVYGSIRELQVVGDRLVGRAYFAAHSDAVQAYENYRDGHLTDFSIGAVAERVEWQDGVKMVTASRPLEGSAVVVGADPTAKAISGLRCYTDPREMLEMSLIEKLRRELEIPAEVEDDSVPQWLKDNIGRSEPVETDSPEQPENEPAATAAGEEATTETGDDEMSEPVETPASEEQRQAVAAEETQRVCAITSLATNHGWPADLTSRAINEKWTVERCSHEQLQRMNSEQSGLPIGNAPLEVGESSVDKFHRAAVDGFRQRAFSGRNFNALKGEAGQFRSLEMSEAVEDVERSFTKPAAGARDFRYASFYDLARSYLEMAGVRNLNGLPRHEVVRRAIRHGDELQRSTAYHATGSFSNLLLDASNKTLLMAYLESPSTWQLWARQAASAPDFKNINRIRFGELPDPDMVPENGTYPDKAVSDSKESYSVDKYGEIFSITLEAMVNDDLDAMARIPAMHGAAMRRKVNRSVYAILTDNAALSDGTALFDAGHSNTDTNALSATNLNTGFTKMMVQAGLDSNTILNIMPRYLIVPPAVSATALQIVNSLADPSNAAASTEDASRPNFNSNTANLYGPNGPRQLVVVTDAYLSSSTSATTWFLAADSSQVDTVEVSFLQGEETPVLEREDGFDVDAVRFKCRQTWGTKAIDYRGLYRGNT